MGNLEVGGSNPPSAIIIMKLNKKHLGFGLSCLIGITGCAPAREDKSLSQVVEQMESIRVIYTNSLTQVDSTMKSVMESRYFSEDKQKEVYNILRNIINGCEEYNTLTLKCPEQPYPLEFSTNRFEWYPLLEKNVNGF